MPITFPICLECRGSQRNCCQDNLVPLTIEDIDRIVSLGFKTHQFIVAGEYAAEDLEGQEDWWVDSMIRIGDKFYKINTRNDADGDCFFLKDGQGCILGGDRPTVCKIFPFWVYDGEIGFEKGEEDFCFFGGQGIKLGLMNIQETETSIRAYFEKIREDCLQNKRRHEEILRNALERVFD